MTNAVKRQDVQPLQFGGEAWLRRLQLRRSKINHENKSYVDCHRNCLWTVTVIAKTNPSEPHHDNHCNRITVSHLWGAVHGCHRNPQPSLHPRYC
jgi:hypothetical protein